MQVQEVVVHSRYLRSIVVVSKKLLKNIFASYLPESADAALPSITDARIDFFLRCIFVDSYCAECKVVYECPLITITGN